MCWESVSVPLWMPLVAFAIPTAVPWWRRRPRFRAGLCQKCGYDLTANVNGRCPECGEVAGGLKSSGNL